MAEQMNKIPGGVWVPTTSPCDSAGRFLPAEFEKAADAVLKEPGVAGLYVCGGTGEGLLMRAGERREAYTIAVEIAKRRGKKVLAHIGAFAMRDALDLAEYAAGAGADGISTVPLPNVDFTGQVEYYRALTTAVALPAVLYYTPGHAQTLPQVLETMAIPGVVGIKSSSNDFFFTMRVMAEKPDGKLVFNGKDEYLAAAVIQGADGGIGMWGSVFPHAYANIYHYAKARDYHRAFDLQSVLNSLCCIAFRMGLLQSFSCICGVLGGWEQVFRPPAPRLDPAFRKAFLAQAGPLIDRLATS